MNHSFEERHHSFAACFNFRDIGGYPAADGRSVKWGLYYRAGRQDRMTPEDLARARELGIKTQIDLRTSGEIEDQSRGPLESFGAQYHHIPVIPDGGMDRLAQIVGDTGISGKRYLGYLELGTKTWLKLFELFAEAERHPLLIHCTAGKDRTGVSTAFLLSVLGVDREIIEADYVMTNQDVMRQLDFLEAADALPHGMSRAELEKVAGVPESAMGDFLDGLEARWGGAVAYLKDIGVSDHQLAAVQSAFL
ncbi:MAG: tyrosine-protein phosphatase, partial [Pseudomonadales bacterium]